MADTVKVRLHDGETTLAAFEGEMDKTGFGLLREGGNLYIQIDGQDIGSLWFHREDGKPVVTLGGWTVDGDWIEADTLYLPAKPGGATVRDERA